MPIYSDPEAKRAAEMLRAGNKIAESTVEARIASLERFCAQMAEVVKEGGWEKHRLGEGLATLLQDLVADYYTIERRQDRTGAVLLALHEHFFGVGIHEGDLGAALVEGIKAAGERLTAIERRLSAIEAHHTSASIGAAGAVSYTRGYAGDPPYGGAWGGGGGGGGNGIVPMTFIGGAAVLHAERCAVLFGLYCSCGAADAKS